MNSPPSRRLLLCSDTARHGLQTSRQSRREYPSLPVMRLEIRQSGFHIHSRHSLAEQMIQFKCVRLSAQPEPDTQKYLDGSCCELAAFDNSPASLRRRVLHRNLHRLCVPSLHGVVCTVRTVIKTSNKSAFPPLGNFPVTSVTSGECVTRVPFEKSLDVSSVMPAVKINPAN